MEAQARKPLMRHYATEPVMQNEDVLPNRQHRMQGRGSDIAINSLVLILPMLLLSAALLALIYYYRLEPNKRIFGNLVNEQDLGQDVEIGVIYVNLRATYLVFIASWSSSLAGVLTTSVMALVSYPIASRYVKTVHSSQPRKMPTPYELALTVGMLSAGGIGSLWAWIKHVGSGKRRRQPQARALTSTVSILILTILFTFLVFLADTWLHVTTKAVNFVQITNAGEVPNYSFGLTGNCTVGNNSYLNQQGSVCGESDPCPCSVSLAVTNTFLVNPTVPIKTLANASDVTTVLTHDLENMTAGGTTAYMFSPSALPGQNDFTASTFGISTQCTPITKSCDVDVSVGAGAPYTCNPVFTGDLMGYPEGLWNETYWTDASMNDTDTRAGVQNPYYYSLAGLVNRGGGASDSLDADPEIATPMHGGTGFILACNVTVYDIEYDWVNGNTVRFERTMSNESTTNAVQTTMSNSGASYLTLQQAGSVAGAVSNTAQELANRYAITYSQTVVAMTAGFLEPRPVQEAQERNTLLVTRVPIIPLFALIAANMLFVILGVVLTCLAVWSCSHDVRDVQARLSIAGIVADRFEGSRARAGVKTVTELFAEKDGQESMRVGITPSDEGGYAYTVWPAGKP